MLIKLMFILTYIVILVNNWMLNIEEIKHITMEIKVLNVYLDLIHRK